MNSDYKDEMARLARVNREEKMADEQVYIDGDGIMINVAYEYHIDFYRCDSPIKILEWVHHLSEKNWATVAVLKSFIDLACKYHKVEFVFA